jgi:hypothetical protein
MSQDQFVDATFSNVPFAPTDAVGPRAAAAGTGEITSRLEAPAARGQIAVNGQVALAPGPGVMRGTLPLHAGENRIEAWLTEGARGGIWRFELGDLVEPGSLTVTGGQVLVVTGDSIAFRMSGRVGERVGFSFRRRAFDGRETR